MNTFDDLLNWDVELVKKVVKHLNNLGIVSDEGKYGLPSTWIERWSDAWTDYLKEYGYEGGPLFPTGKYFHGYGAIYGLYNTVGINYEYAMQYINNLADSKT